MLYVIPIEPIQERYSEQWLKWTKNYLADKDSHHIINPREYAYDTISSGSFLDVIGTNVYKNKQMEIILSLFEHNRVKDGDVFWFHDLWFPGIEQLAYIRDGLGLKFKICGYLHAGTYDKYDFLAQKGMGVWAEHFENCLFQIVDNIFVATNYHKKLLIENRKVMDRRVHVVPFPIYPDFAKGELELYHLRQPIVVFPHRLDMEKNPRQFDALETALAISGKQKFKFIKTKEVTQSKSEYYNILKKAKYAVSFASQETWGIAMQEAVMCGCIPIVPDRLSYSEMYAHIFKYVPEIPNNKDWHYEAPYAVQDKILSFEGSNEEYVQHAIDRQREEFVLNGASAFESIERWLFPESLKPKLMTPQPISYTHTDLTKWEEDDES